MVGTNGLTLVGVVNVEHLLRVFGRLFDEDAFLSPYGLRALSRFHATIRSTLDIGGYETTIDYEPAESTTGMFGGNSNWRGPIWFPVNYLVVDALFRYARYFGDELTLEYPTGSGRPADARRDRRGHPERLISLFLVDENGRRPCFGWVERLRDGSRLEGQHRLQRVLPRRQRCRARGLAPDGMDRNRRGHDPSQRRCGDPDARRAARADAGRGGRMIALGPQACGTLEESSRREWLVADGLGGYAMGTVAGLRTRRYHGLLVVASAGPSARMLGLAALDPVLVVGDARHRLACDEWASGVVDPPGYELLVSFELDRGVPRWRWQVGDVVLEREVSMAHGHNAVGVVHRLVALRGRYGSS